MIHYFVDESCIVWSDPDMYISLEDQPKGYFHKGGYFIKRETALKYLKTRLEQDKKDIQECINKIEMELSK